MSYNPFARERNTVEEWKIVDKFDSAYWSGLDVQVYADNILLEEAIQLNYYITEQVRPYYGYASFVPDRMHHGSRLIQGELSMNFKRDGYLFSLMQHLKVTDPSESGLPPQAPVRLERGGSARPPLPYVPTTWGPSSLEKLKDVDPNIARDLVERYRAAASEQVVNEKPPMIPSNRGIFETRPEGFDLTLIFGANLKSSMILRYLDGNSYSVESHDSNLADGAVIQDAATQKGIIAGTGIRLVGVSILGIGRSVNDDGRPIIETYSFQARDVVILTPQGIPVSDTPTVINEEEQDPLIGEGFVPMIGADPLDMFL
jgi:hypothetical protein